ncbi:hypothetical protein CPC08DRAFT_814550 [Agrocybe pediades]|nr:hypothetical protein CPC08DRAFT_814550 [Agrocybe pediades]
MSTSPDSIVVKTTEESLSTFLSSLQGDGSSLDSFLCTWTTFCTTIREHHQTLKQDTIAAVHSVTSVIDAIASSLLALHDETERLSQETSADISDILAKEMNQLYIQDEGQGDDLHSQEVYPPFVHLCYGWLLSNLHHPYPPKEVRNHIASQAGTSLKDIDSWFLNVRKSIGWNTLRKTRFPRNQDAMLKAADSILNKGSLFNNSFVAALPCEIKVDEELRLEFARIVDKANSLYPGLQPIAERTSYVAPQTPPRIAGDLASKSYPTPRPSPERSVQSPSRTPYVETSPLPKVSLKRGRSLFTAAEREGVPEKRLRVETYPIPDAPRVAALPSPASSVDFVEEEAQSVKTIQQASIPPRVPLNATSPQMKRKRDPSNAGSQRPSKRCHTASTSPSSHSGGVVAGKITEPPQTTADPAQAVASSINVSVSKRKRRLSDVGTQRPEGAPKWPGNTQCLPRHQTVSDPLPLNTLSVVFDDNWYQDTLGAPHYFSSAIPSAVHPVSQGCPTIAVRETALEVQSHQYDFSLQQSGLYPPATLDMPHMSMPSIFNPEMVQLDIHHQPFSPATQIDMAQISFNHLASLPRPNGLGYLQEQQLFHVFPSAVNEAYNGAVLSYDMLDHTSNITELDFSIQAKRARCRQLQEEISRLEGEINAF